MEKTVTLFHGSAGTAYYWWSISTDKTQNTLILQLLVGSSRQQKKSATAAWSLHRPTWEASNPGMEVWLLLSVLMRSSDTLSDCTLGPLLLLRPDNGSLMKLMSHRVTCTPVAPQNVWELPNVLVQDREAPSSRVDGFQIKVSFSALLL